MAGPFEGATPEELAVLRKFGFELDTAYMPVPRCDTCRWWKRSGYDPAVGCAGECLRVVANPESGPVNDPDTKARAYPESYCEPVNGKLYTEPNFGCVQWEAKDGD